MTAQTAALLILVVILTIGFVAQTLAITKLLDERAHLLDEWREALEGWDRAMNAERHALRGWTQALDDHEHTLNAIDTLDPP